MNKKLRTEEEIISNWKGDNKEPTVSICSITYNHQEYIEETLEGFLNQETDYSFEILIHDDASTDRTADIIREYEIIYPNIIKPIYQKENQKSKGFRMNPTFNFPRAKGAYIAICDGDDYWISNYKLQMQVDFLVNNQNYGLVFTDVDYLYQKSNTTIESYDKTFLKNIPTGEITEYLLYSNPFKTCTAVFEKDLLTGIENYLENKKFLMGDKIIWLILSSKKNIGYINNSTAVYRISQKSVSHSRNLYKYRKFLLSSKYISKEFAKKQNYKLDEKKIDRTIEKAIIKHVIEFDKKETLKFLLKKPFLVAKIIFIEKVVKNCILLCKTYRN